jgi:hypothetical protein
MQVIRFLIPATFALVLLPQAALAQWGQWTDRVLIGINGAAQLTSGTMDDSFEYDHPYGAQRERASVVTTYDVPTGAVFDGGVAIRLAGNLGVGVTVSVASSTGDLAVRALIPHPFYFEQFREVEGAVAARHGETTIHVQAVYVVPLSPKMKMTVAAGPSRFSVEQRVARSVTVSETFPFDTAAFADAPLETVKNEAWGFNVGVDVAWMFTNHLGVGGLVRFARANATLAPADRDSFDMEVGGLYAGGGARIAF